MEKKPFVTLEQLQEIVKEYPTPFHIYDEKGFMENARKVNEAFAWNKGFREYFAAQGSNPCFLHLLTAGRFFNTESLGKPQAFVYNLVRPMLRYYFD